MNIEIGKPTQREIRSETRQGEGGTQVIHCTTQADSLECESLRKVIWVLWLAIKLLYGPLISQKTLQPKSHIIALGDTDSARARLRTIDAEKTDTDLTLLVCLTRVGQTKTRAKGVHGATVA